LILGWNQNAGNYWLYEVGLVNPGIITPTLGMLKTRGDRAFTVLNRVPGTENESMNTGW
jgi:hypothetical protein